MKVKEIKALIRAKKSEIRSTQNKVALSNDAAEVRSLGEVLDKLREELDELEAKLDEAEEGAGTGDSTGTDSGTDSGEGRSNVPDGAEFRGFNAYDAIGSGEASASGMRTIASFGGNARNTGMNPLDGLALRSNESFVSRLGNSGKEKLDLGKYIRGAISGNWDGAEAERRSMTTSTSGVVIPQVLAAEVLDTARNISFFTGAGCPTVPLTNGNMTIARVASDPTFKFYEEMAEAEESSMSLEGVELKAKTARGFCYISRELLESATNLHGVLTQAFAGAVAEMIDAAGLYGQYDSVTKKNATYAPSGIMNDENIGTVVAENEFYHDYIKAIGVVRRANGTPDTIGYNAAGEEAMNLIHDGNGNPIAIPKVIDDMNKVVTNSLKEDSDNGSDAIIMDKRSVIVGIQNNIRVRMTDTSDYCIKHGCVCFDVTAMIDVATVRPSHICKITGIKPME